MIREYTVRIAFDDATERLVGDAYIECNGEDVISVDTQDYGSRIITLVRDVGFLIGAHIEGKPLDGPLPR